MKRCIILPIILLLSMTSLHAQSSLHLDLFFQKDADLLTENSMDEFYFFLEEHSIESENTELYLEVYPSLSNVMLEERIQNLNDLLVVNNFSTKKIIYFKKQEHIYFDYKKMANWDFIRIQFKQSIPLPKTQNRYLSDNTKLISEIEETIITNNQSTTVFLKKGTIIEIEENSFVNQSGETIKDGVVLKTEEIFDIKDAIFSNATTNMGDQFLESNGMIKIEALDRNGEKLFLAKDKSLSISLPVQENEISNDFELYKGILNENAYDWILQDQDLNKKQSDDSISIRYVWKKISKQERAAIAAQRKKIVDEWKANGKKSKSIRKRLKRYKTYAKNRHKRSKKRPSIYPKSKRTYDKLSKNMILGNTKYRWHKDTLSNRSMIFYYEFKSFSLGMFNIDRIYKSKEPREDLLVINKESREIKIFFTDAFVLINGETKDGITTFPNIPMNKKIVLISTLTKLDDKIEFGFSRTESGKAPYEIKDFDLYSKADYKKKIKAITNGSE